MPIQHTVLFQLVHERGSPQETSFLAFAAQALPAIQGVRDFRIREQINPTSHFTHQISMVFADEKSYREYQDHPKHRLFGVERWDPEVLTFQDFDFLI